MPEASELKQAELRLYKRPHSHHSDTNFFITVFCIDDQVTADASTANSMEYSLTVLDTLSVNSSYDGWLVFNVTGAMSSWKESKATNRGLYIQTHSVSGRHVYIRSHIFRYDFAS